MKIYFLYTISYASENLPYEETQIVDKFHEEISENFLCSCKYLSNHLENVNEDFFNKLYELLENPKAWWSFFKKTYDFSPQETYGLNLLLNAIKEKNYEDFTKILCKLQIYEKIYKFIKDKLEKSQFFDKNYFNKKTCIKKIQNLIKENKEPLVENDNILYTCEILNTIYYHLLKKKEKNPQHILYTYNHFKIQIIYEKNQYDVDEKKINELLLDFKNLDINNYKELKKTCESHQKSYNNLLKFIKNI